MNEETEVKEVDFPVEMMNAAILEGLAGRFARCHNSAVAVAQMLVDEAYDDEVVKLCFELVKSTLFTDGMEDYLQVGPVDA